MIVAGLGGLLASMGTASADVDSVEGTGFGISVSVAGSPVIAPTPDPTVTPPHLVADESSAPAAFGPFNASAVTIGGILGILNNGVSAGPVSTQAGNIVGDNHAGFVATAAQVANVNLLAQGMPSPWAPEGEWDAYRQSRFKFDPYDVGRRLFFEDEAERVGD